MKLSFVTLTVCTASFSLLACGGDVSTVDTNPELEAEAVTDSELEPVELGTVDQALCTKSIIFAKGLGVQGCVTNSPHVVCGAGFAQVTGFCCS